VVLAYLRSVGLAGRSSRWARGEGARAWNATGRRAARRYPENCIILIIIIRIRRRWLAGRVGVERRWTNWRAARVGPTLRHRSRAPFAARPSDRRPSGRRRRSAVETYRIRRRDVFIGKPQIDRCVRNWRFNVSAPSYTAPLQCSTQSMDIILYYTAGTSNPFNAVRHSLYCFKNCLI